jgi:hypothetical protein
VSTNGFLMSVATGAGAGDDDVAVRRHRRRRRRRIGDQRRGRRRRQRAHSAHGASLLLLLREQLKEGGQRGRGRRGWPSFLASASSSSWRGFRRRRIASGALAPTTSVGKAAGSAGFLGCASSLALLHHLRLLRRLGVGTDLTAPPPLRRRARRGERGRGEILKSAPFPRSAALPRAQLPPRCLRRRRR